MRLFDHSFWAFYAHTGRVPAAPASSALGDASTPLALKGLSYAVLAPGNEQVDPKAIQDKVERNALRVPKPVMQMITLAPQRIMSDAMGVPQSMMVPLHQSIATYLNGK